jgi:PAS domain S-box-containing protein
MGPLKIVHLEDSDPDAELVKEQLRIGGIECELIRVQTEQEFKRAIKHPGVDIILADRNCPAYDGFRALALARDKRPDLPYIFVSGTLNHQDAIDSLSAGVTDFVFKEHLPQLVPAVRRVVRESQAWEDLRSAQQNLLEHAELLDLANDGIIICDAEGKITYWNQGAERIYGWSKTEAVGQNARRLLKTWVRDGSPDLEATLTEGSHWEGELRQVTRDGNEIIVASHWTLTGRNQQSPRLQINTDITAQKRAEAELRETQEQYRRFVEEDFTGNVVMRPDGQIVRCNPAFARIFGFDSVAQAQTANFVSLLRTRTDGAGLVDLVSERDAVETHELEMRQRDGDPVYVVARFLGTFNDAAELLEIQGYLFNDTKRKRLEQQLIQSQKMEGLGTLAGGIAHDFNNILAIILGYATRLEGWRANPERVPAAVTVIKEAVERGAALVQQLLTSARQTEARFSSIDLNGLIRDLEKMLHATVPKTINFELRLQRDLPLITADRSQIHQVLLNLCINARDAMQNGGTLTLETSLLPGSRVAESFTGADAANYVCIRVRDTGVGMTRQVKAHIFEPFFTTKERSKGTGLGLSVVYGVVNNHHGFLQVDTEPNVGTTFSIYLPLDAASGRAPTETVTAPAEKRSASRTILLVEDEEQLRELGIAMLEGEGYRVIAAKDGVEGVELFEANSDQIGLVVCDLGLPRLGGRDAFMKMKATKPNVRAIVASGYLEPAMRSEMLQAGVIDTIQKPYDFSEMLEKVRSILGGAEAADDHPRLF